PFPYTTLSRSRADAAMAIANPNNLLRLQSHIAGAIVNHDKIVARAVHLSESQHDVDLSESPCSINIVVAANASPARTSAAEDLQTGTPASTVQLLKTIGAIIGLALLATSATAAGLNSLILEQIAKMPSGGKYSVSHFAKIKLESTAHFESGKFFVAPTKPYVSFCSGATYLVFIKAIEELRDRGQLQLDYATLNQLII